MTDKELLELAAKAAGCNPVYNDALKRFFVDDPRGLVSEWNPLTDDGDALRLAVKLNLAIRPMEKCVFVELAPETLLGQSSVSELEMYVSFPDINSATRSAIVRAAAEIGRTL